MQRLTPQETTRSIPFLSLIVPSRPQFRWVLWGGYFILLPVTVYAIIACMVTWPLVIQLNTHLLGSLSTTDSIEHLRMIWWTKYALQHGLNPFYQSLFGYPDGFFSTVQWAQPLVYGPAALLGFLVKPVTALNVWLIIILVLDGLTAYWLCLALVRDQGVKRVTASAAAVLGGIVFMIFPAAQGHLLPGQLNIISNYGLPILTLCLYRIINGRGSRRVALVGAIALWALLLSNYTGIIFLVFPLILFGSLHWLLIQRRKVVLDPANYDRVRPTVIPEKTVGWRPLLGQLLIVFGVGALLTAPFYMPLVLDSLDPAHAAYLKTQGAGWILFSTDLLSYIAPSPYTPWTKPLAPDFSYTILNANSIEGTAYLGLVAVGLASIALYYAWRQAQKSKPSNRAGLWLLILLGSMLFALGPLLKWREQPVVYAIGLDKSNIVLPWALFQNLPLIDIIRTPGRFNLLSGLALGVLAALGLSILLERITRRSIRIGLFSLLVIAVIAEYQQRFPMPTFAVTEPSYFSALAARPDIRAVFDVPYLNTHKEGLLEQMVDQKPIMAGYYSRLTPVDPSKLMLLSEAARGLAWQSDANTVRFPGQIPAADDVRALLKDNEIDVVVYHWALLDRATTMTWALQAFGSAAYQDNDIGVFEVPAPVHRTTNLIWTHTGQYYWPYSAPDSGWWPQTADNERTEQATSITWLKSGAQFVTYAAAATLTQLTLNVTAYLQARTLRFTLDGLPLQVSTVDQTHDQVRLWLPLSIGFHTLQLSVDNCTPLPVPPECLETPLLAVDSSPNSACQPLAQPTCISMQMNGFQAIDSTVPYQASTVELDHGLALVGFRVPDQVQTGNTLAIETDWSAQQKLPGDYHWFVHVVDTNGNLIAQADGIPGGGNYPTTAWSAPQHFNQAAPIAIPSTIAAGTYNVYCGWYRYPDMTRLSVLGQGQQAANGLLWLKSITIHA